jgi:hypothetical protein
MIGEEDYINQFSLTYSFVRNRCGTLADTNRQVFDRVLKCFKAQGIAILTDQEGNIETTRPLGVVGLLRMFESFLEQDSGTPKHRIIPRGNRYPQRPFIWRMASSIIHKHTNQAAEPASIIQDNLDPTERDLLSHIEQHRESCLSQFLKRNGAAGQRFRNLRRDRLVLHDESANSNRINGMAGNILASELAPVEPVPRELPGSPYRFCNQTAPGCFHFPCSCRATTPPPSSSSSPVL